MRGRLPHREAATREWPASRSHRIRSDGRQQPPNEYRDDAEQDEKDIKK
jgi:hypothetical protein